MGTCQKNIKMHMAIFEKMFSKKHGDFLDCAVGTWQKLGILVLSKDGKNSKLPDYFQPKFSK